MNTETLPPYKDRKAGLVIFGVLTMGMGLLCGLLVPLVIFAQSMAAKAPGAHPVQPPQQLVMISGVYGIAAIVLIWLGIGSIMARRWARALLLVYSWSWLITGLLSLIFLATMAPQFIQTIQSAQPPGQPKLDPATRMMILLIPGVILLLILLILPAIWTLFYRSRHVKATCEVRDPVERWTDRCPLPVLAISLWLAFGALMMLLMPISYRGVFPFFGNFVVGPMGAVLYILMALIWGYAAYALYKLDRRGWWLIFIALVFFSISCVLTYSRHDLMELYQLMGYSGEQLAQFRSVAFMKSGMMAWSSVIYTVPFLIYLIYIRKFFVPSNQAVDVKAD